MEFFGEIYTYCSPKKDKREDDSLRLQIESKDIDFHKLIEYSLNTILIVGEDGSILYCNKACVDLLKADSADEILYRNIFSYVHPDFHSTCEERFKLVIEKSEIAELVDQKIVTHKGHTIDIEIMAVPYYLNNRVLAQLTIRDITSRKVAEQLLKDRERLSSLGQIAAGIAHEVKNPLTSVKGFLQLLKETNSHVYLDTMEKELDSALYTLQNFLQVSKPDLDDEPFVEFNILKELDSMLFLFQEKLYDIHIEKDFQDAEVKITGQKNMLIKAFFNLVKNAIEAINDKGKITIHHFYTNGYLHITIGDTGVGIPEDKIKLLGTPFYSTKDEGTGLGLTQVYTTIHKHGGNIFVESIEGKGTTFHVQIPMY
jgi:two-component system, sporulation sensor kinase A